ncbi:MAG: signal peptidase II [Deltaproteobacteria bacterium]|nr:MAG: signal peptidase II [Deltaproteobacteria bacterium]
MKKKYLILTGVAPVILLIDQFSKYYIDSHFLPHRPVAILNNFFQINYIRNIGAAFGLFSNLSSELRGPLFISISILAILMILSFFIKLEDRQRLLSFSFSLILGGALGNFIDRIRLGYVIDFLDIHWYDYYHWPAFNIADTAITVGVILLLLEIITGYKEERDSGSDQISSHSDEDPQGLSEG